MDLPIDVLIFSGSIYVMLCLVDLNLDKINLVGNSLTSGISIGSSLEITSLNSTNLCGYVTSLHF
jgi:hypothetical protein